MLAYEIGEQRKRDHGSDDHGTDRTEQAVEPALHRRANPQILVPSHARRELQQMAEAHAERKRSKQDRDEADGLKEHWFPSRLKFAGDSGAVSAAMEACFI
jgi:hypothetical protein